MNFCLLFFNFIRGFFILVVFDRDRGKWVGYIYVFFRFLYVDYLRTMKRMFFDFMEI